MTDSICAPAPAKLNLFLHINSRRADGYHELQTLFQFIDLHDNLSFIPTTDGQITLTSTLEGVPEQDNLVIRAAHLLQSQAPEHPGARIHLEKHLPMGAGIGGGSSDAATTLMILNQLWNIHLNPPKLAQLGQQLGADVPIFIAGYAAFAQGIGEQLTPMNPPEHWYVLLTPKTMVSTAKVFNDPQLTRDTPKIKVNEYNWANTHNDCQSIVMNHYPEVALALQWLVEYGSARMTGTGRCVFAPFTSESEALDVAARCPARFQARVCKGLNQSPLHQCLTQKGW